MSMLTIRNIETSIKEQLRINAAKEGISMEEKARRILRQALEPSIKKRGLASRIQQKVIELGGDTTLDIPPRSVARQNVDFNHD